MKKSTISICLLLFCIITQNALSQNQKAISEHAIWCTHYQIGFPPTESYFIYKSAGDTVINGTNYIKLFRAPAHLNGFFSYNQDGPFTYSYAFRNDTYNRAYILPATDNIEHLWYDFNLSIGDTLPGNSTWYSTQYLNPGDTIIVNNIDSILYCNEYHKRYIFNGMFPNLVCGVGFNGDLININGDYFEYNVALDFFCSDTLISNCCFTITGIQNIDNNISDILLYPNPVIDILSVTLTDKAKIEILSIEGQLIKTINIAEKQAIIDVAELSSGIYIIRVKTDKGIAVKKFIKE
jgi:hypothetical protein